MSWSILLRGVGKAIYSVPFCTDSILGNHFDNHEAETTKGSDAGVNTLTLYTHVRPYSIEMMSIFVSFFL